MTNKQEEVDSVLDDLNKAIELNPDDTTAYINRAKYYYKNSEQERVLIDFIKAIELAPNDSDNYISIIKSFCNEKHYDLALAVLTKLIEISPDAIDAYKYYNERGTCYSFQEHNDLALSDYEKSIKLKPDDAYVYCHIGNHYRSQEKYELSIENLNKAIELDPCNASFYNDRANYYYEKKSYNMAILDYNKAVKIEPNHSILYSNIAKCYTVQKIHLLSLINFNKAIELEPSNLEHYYRRAQCYFNKGSYDESIDDYTKLIELESSNSNYYNERGLCYDKKKNYEKAILDYTKAIDLEPNNDILYANRAECYENQKEYDLAYNDYGKADGLVDDLKTYDHNGNPSGNYYHYEIKSNEIHYHHLLNSQYDEKQKIRKNLTKLNEKIESNPDIPELYCERAKCHQELEDYDLAIADYDKAIELDPECADSYYKRGIFYFEQENFELSMGDFNQSINLNHNNSDYYLKRGVCYLDQEEHNLAFIDFNKTVELNHKSYLAYHHLANHYYDNSEYDLGLDNIDKAIQFSDSLELKKDYCFFGKSIACHVKKYDKAREYIEKIFENVDSKEKQHKDIYLQDIDKEEALEEKNRQLEQEIKEKEAAYKAVHAKEQEMLSFFTHTMRNALSTAPEALRQAIKLLGSEDYETDKKHYKAINKIAGLFSTLSLTDCLIDTFKQSISDPEEFQQAWKKDNSGEATPEWVLASALRQSLNRIIFQPNTDELRRLLNQADTSAVIAMRKSFIDTILPLNLDHEGVDAFYDWLSSIDALEISMDSDMVLSFGVNQVKFSLLFAITSELLLNALKYWDGTGKIKISWHTEQAYLVFKVVNPCQSNARSSLAGTHKGLAFIKRLIELLDDQAIFTPIAEERRFTVEFKLHQSLLG